MNEEAGWPVDGQVYRHFKGRLYLVLGVAYPEGLSGANRTEDERFVVWVSRDVVKGTRLLATPKRFYEENLNRGGVTRIFEADYVGGTDKDVRRLHLVVYVGLYDNPRGNRVLLRPVEEWREKVKIPGVIAPEGMPHYLDQPARVQRRYELVKA